MMNTTYLIVDDGRAIVCLICDRKSWNTNDVEKKYCGYCKVFHEEHRTRHALLQRMLDEIVADFISHTYHLPSNVSVMDLMKWSSSQVDNPTEGDRDDK
jgi:hypothetical protein